MQLLAILVTSNLLPDSVTCTVDGGAEFAVKRSDMSDGAAIFSQMADEGFVSDAGGICSKEQIGEAVIVRIREQG